MGVSVAERSWRILYLTDGFPYPLLSGRLRHYHFIRSLAADHDVTLLSTVAPEHPEGHAAAFSDIVPVIRTFPSDRLSRSVRSKVPERLRALVGEVSDRGVSDLLTAAADLHRQAPFDVVVNARIESPVHRFLPGVPVILDLCDAMTSLVRGQRIVSPRRARLRLAMKEAVISRVEQRMLLDADLVLLSTADEVERLRRSHPAASAPTAIVTNGVDPAYWQRRTDRLGDAIVFSGAMNYPPNEAAAVTLVRDILPAVRARVPGARLILAGRDPSARLREVAEHVAGVEITGTVDDLRPWLEQAAVFAAPFRFAAGIQNKLLEAMAMAIPVVTVAGAATGVSAIGSEPPAVTVARTTAEFAAAVVDALRSPDPRPATAARAYVMRHFTWAGATDRLTEVMAESIRGRRSEP